METVALPAELRPYLRFSISARSGALDAEETRDLDSASANARPKEKPMPAVFVHGVPDTHHVWDALEEFWASV